MTYRPLDGVFLAAKQQSESAGKIAIRPAAILGSIAVLALTSSAVYATNVTINSDSSISYSQGTQVIAPCDPDGIGVDLDFAFNPTVNVFALTKKYQKLTGVHRDCYSTYNGERKILKVQFYEGTTLQLQVSGTMPVKSYNSWSVNATTNTVVFGGFNNNPQTDPFTIQSLNDASCAATNPKGDGLDAGSLLCGLSINLSTLDTTSNNGKSAISWGTGCSAIPNQPIPGSNCFPFHIAYNTDRIVIEIE